MKTQRLIFSLFQALVFVAVGMTVLAGCTQSPKSKQGVSQKRSFTEYLSQEEAVLRESQIDGIRYTLSIDLAQSETVFVGKAEIHFNVKRIDQDLRMDLYKSKITQMTLNGQTLDQVDYSDYAIRIPAKRLQSGPNVLQIAYESPYGKFGYGLHRFVDPEDQRVYLFTQFEPNRAHYLFPSFDQPDLRASYKLDVLAPADWHVVSAVRESVITGLGKTRKWDFPESEKFSTYLFSLHAGPYKVWEDKSSKIPMRLFVRQSMAKYVKPAEWFEPLKFGLRFFAAYFKTPFPYSKYDQVIAPEFPGGAMENVGAVAFGEWTIEQTSPRTLDSRYRLENVILHEAAHMWFGNLVTMRWWDDLWLKESFATFMASRGLMESPLLRDRVPSRIFSEKLSAYSQDDLRTTHAVYTSVEDINALKANYDSLTYQKGAALLRQLASLLGEKSWQGGLQRYFSEFQNQSVTHVEFLKAIKDSTQTDLEAQWADQWIKSKGVNRIQSSFECQDGKAKIQLVQLPPKNGDQMKSHRVDILPLWSHPLRKDSIRIGSRLSPTLNQANVFTLDSFFKQCPQALVLNDLENGYYIPLIDKKSTEFLLSRNLDESLPQNVRLAIWSSLKRQVYEGNVSYLVFIDYLLKEGLAKEREAEVLNYLLSSSGEAARFMQSNLNGREAQFQVRLMSLEETVYQLLLKAPGGSETQATAWQIYLGSFENSRVQNRLSDLYSGKVKLKGWQWSSARRWELVLRRAYLGDKQALVDGVELAKSDTSVKAQLGQKSLEVINMTFAEKRAWLDRVFIKMPESTAAEVRAQLGSISGGLPPGEFFALYGFSLAQDFEKVLKNLPKEIHYTPAWALFPRKCSIENIEMIRKLTTSKSFLQFAEKPLQRMLLDNGEGLERCHFLLERL